MPESVVDVLEAVQVDDIEADGHAETRGRRQLFRQAGEEGAAVHQAGQGIGAPDMQHPRALFFQFIDARREGVADAFERSVCGHQFFRLVGDLRLGAGACGALESQLALQRLKGRMKGLGHGSAGGPRLVVGDGGRPSPESA